jgi:hypothetical protein
VCFLFGKFISVDAMIPLRAAALVLALLLILALLRTPQLNFFPSPQLDFFQAKKANVTLQPERPVALGAFDRWAADQLELVHAAGSFMDRDGTLAAMSEDQRQAFLLRWEEKSHYGPNPLVSPTYRISRRYSSSYSSSSFAGVPHFATLQQQLQEHGGMKVCRRAIIPKLSSGSFGRVGIATLASTLVLSLTYVWRGSWRCDYLPPTGSAARRQPLRGSGPVPTKG